MLLVVGIAGGLPSDDLCLGDIVLSTRVHDFSLEARKFQDATTYNVGGGPIQKSIAAGIANLSARESELGAWGEDLPPKPSVKVSQDKVYGPSKWKKEVLEKLRVHYGRNVPPREPHFNAGPIASSDRLVKDPMVLFPWITTARGILAIEMESAGVHRATRDRTPMLSIRGLSDIVGFKRQDAWTKYACASAAAFTRAYLMTQPVDVRELPKTTPEPEILSTGSVPPQRPARPGKELEEGFTNLIPLRHFPDILYVARARCKTRKQGWAILNENSSPKSTSRVPGEWTIHDDNLYSLVDPEQSRLKEIIEEGTLEEFDSREWAQSEDQDKRRLFVQLLNSALREDLWSQGVRYHGDQDVYAFMRHPEDEARRFKYQNLKVKSTVTVVMRYEQKSKDGRIYPYFRHSAFQARFRFLGDEWFLEITPTYRFTFDGKTLDRFHDKRLSGIKRFERNRSVLSQLLVWQAILRAPWTRTDRLRLLEFAPMVSFEFDSGVIESSLTPLDNPAVPPSIAKELEE